MIKKLFSISNDKIITYITDHIMTRGYAWHKNEFYKPDGIAALLKEINTPDDFIESTASFNGCFSLYKETEEYVFLASDMFGSYPLFYAVKDNDIIVSDNTEWIVMKTGYDKINKKAERDITYTGYSYHNETLVKGIFQVIASECIIINKRTRAVERRLHFTYTFEKNNILNSVSAASIFDDICSKTADRLVKSLEGRNCIVFLSGGVDSRFCAYLLKIAGYSEKTTLLTYGSKFSPDYKAAVKTAKALGMKHLFISYKRKDWRNTYNDSESIAFLRYSQNLSISSHLREHFVIKELLEKDLISKNDIIVPGHLGTVAGRKYTFKQLKDSASTHRRLVDKTVLFYNMNRFKGGTDYLLERTHSLFPQEENETDPMFFLSMYNNAATCTYSIKYLMNSLRAYDFYGLQWRLPLLDYELVSFFNHLPFEEISSKTFFKNYISSKIDVHYSKFSLNFIRKVFRNILDTRYACINLYDIFTLKNEYNSELPALTRAYRYIRNFSAYCAVYEIEMMKEQLKKL